MTENAYVVVFPSVFAKNKLNQLTLNIKKILKIKKQQFQKISRDNSLIIVKANDPVFASSAINLLFGIEKVAIAKKVKNDFNIVLSEISKIGSNLLLKNEKFFVKVEGHSSGYTAKDLEMSATSSIIDKTVKLGAKPGTSEKYDKLLCTFLTKLNAYVCIFIDEGQGGIPYNSQNENVVCAVYDELSAISCLQTIRNGFDVKIIVCYKKESDLVNLVKILNQILPRMIKSQIVLEFFQIPIKGTGSRNLLTQIDSVTEILILVAKANKIKRISLALSPLIFPLDFFENSMQRILESDLVGQAPLSGLNDDIFETAREMRLGGFLQKIEKLGKVKFSNHRLDTKDIQKIAKNAFDAKKIVSISQSPNNIHNILDSLKLDH